MTLPVAAAWASFSLTPAPTAATTPQVFCAQLGADCLCRLANDPYPNDP
jgi:hypothetical protein